MTRAKRRATPAELRAFLAPHPPAVRTLAQQLRKVVLAVVPDAIEQIDQPAHLLGYGFAPTYRHTVCVIMPLKAGVNLGFPSGTDLPDPQGLLIGTGKRARHVKLTQPEQISAPVVHDLLMAASAMTPRREPTE